MRLMIVTVLLTCLTATATETATLTPALRKEIDATADKAPWAPLKHQRFDAAGDVVGWAASRLPLDEGEEAKGAAEALKKVKGNLSDPPEKLQALFNRLVALLPKRLAGTREYQLLIASDKTINAFTVGDGKIVMNQGLLDQFPTVDHPAIAMVLAHEIGHNVRGHCTRGYQLKRAVRTLGDELMGKTYGGLFGVTLNAAGIAVPFLYTREQEFEADVFALHLCRNAGLDLDSCLDLHRKLIVLKQSKDAKTGNLAYLFSSHPDTVLRLKWLRMELNGIPAGPGHGLQVLVDGKLHKAMDNAIDLGAAIILVHGMEGSEKSFLKMAEWLQKQDGYKARPILLHTFPNDDSLSKNGQFLKNELRRAGNKPGSPVFICHSAGGLVARHYVEKLNGRYTRLIMIGTPQHGSDLAKIRGLLEPFEMATTISPPGTLGSVLKPYADGRGQITYDLQPDSLFLNHLGTKAENPKKYFIIRGQWMSATVAAGVSKVFTKSKDLLSQHAEAKIESPFLKAVTQEALRRCELPDEILAGDGAVTLERALLPDVESMLVKKNHVSMTRSKTVFKKVDELIQNTE